MAGSYVEGMDWESYAGHQDGHLSGTHEIRPYHP